MLGGNPQIVGILDVADGEAHSRGKEQWCVVPSEALESTFYVVDLSHLMIRWEDVSNELRGINYEAQRNLRGKITSAQSKKRQPG